MSVSFTIVKHASSGATTTYAITNYLDPKSSSQIAQEEERDAFERVVSDVHLRVSNLTRYFSGTVFVGAYADEWELVASDDISGVTLFRGWIEMSTIEFGVAQEWVEFDAFSATSRMWQECGEHTMGEFTHNLVQGFGVWQGLQYVMGIVFWHIGLTYQSCDFGVFANRQIRYADDSTTYGNRGRMRELNPDMTIKEFMEGLALYYNAAFYVEPSNQKVTMRPRNTILSTIVTSLDGFLGHDEKLVVQWEDAVKYDYVKTFVINPFKVPVFDRAEERTRQPGVPNWVGGPTQYYLVTYQFSSMSGVVFASEQVQVTLPYSYQEVFLHVPAITGIPSGVTVTRKLYRYDPRNQAWRYCFYTWTDLIAHYFSDPAGEYVLYYSTPLPSVKHDVGAFFSYDQDAGTWNDPSYEFQPTPVGKIFDARPQFQFTEIGDPTTLREYSSTEVLQFFNNDNSVTNIQTQFRELLLSKRRAKMMAEGTFYKLGDGFASPVLSAYGGLPATTQYVVKKAVTDTNNEQTLLEMLPT